MTEEWVDAELISESEYRQLKAQRLVDEAKQRQFEEMASFWATQRDYVDSNYRAAEQAWERRRQRDREAYRRGRAESFAARGAECAKNARRMNRRVWAMLACLFLNAVFLAPDIVGKRWPLVVFESTAAVVFFALALSFRKRRLHWRERETYWAEQQV